MIILTYIVATTIFLVTMLGLAIGMLLGRRQLQCSCKGTARVMGEAVADPCPKASTCSRRLVDDTRLIQTPAVLPDRDS
jgi:hypothetical protein